MVLNDKAIKNKIAKCVTVAIDVCIEIDAIEFLQNTILTIFESKGYGDIFYKKLEPFILSSRINSTDINSSTVTKIINAYVKNKNFTMLSQLLIRLKLEDLKQEYLKSFLEEYNLVTPMIYMYTIIQNNVSILDYL